MVKRITIINFKAISFLSLELTPFTMLIGENSSGKSTVLQALDFLFSITSRDINEYLREREWDFSDIKSQFSKHDESMRFTTTFDIDGVHLLWDISIISDFNKLQVKESIIDADTDECYLSNGLPRPDWPFDFSQLNIESSALKMLDIDRENTTVSTYAPILYKLKSLLTSSRSFELLSPDRMRSRSSRGKAEDIGTSGERLAAYIHMMSSSRKSELSKTVSDFIGQNVKVITSTKDSSGRVEMLLEETWKDNIIKIKKRYISDGLLRIIAFTAILINHDNKKQVNYDSSVKSIVMLDEIEDGINPHHSEKLIGSFKKAVEETKRQVIITSHSPVLLNSVDEDDILFMWRDSRGMIRAAPLFQSAQMKEMLDVLNPGEVWLNYSRDRIIEMLTPSPEDEK